MNIDKIIQFLIVIIIFIIIIILLRQWVAEKKEKRIAYYSLEPLKDASIPLIDKIKNKIRWRIIIKCKFNNEIIEALNTSLKDLNSKKLKDVKTIIDLNPTNMM